MTMRRGYTPIKVISVKRDKPGVPRPEGAYDSSHKPSDEDELHDYHARFGPLGDPQGDIGQSLSLTHLHYHHSSPRRQLPPVPSLTSRTRCSPLMSALIHSGTRPRSTESSSHRIWRLFALICVRCWPTRPLFFNSISRFRPSLHSFLPTTSHHHSHHGDLPAHQGSSLHLLLLFHCQWGHCPFLVEGGVGGARVFFFFS